MPAGVLLVRGAQTVGLDGALTSALGPWTQLFATHLPGKVVLDVAMALALGGDCLADVAVLRSEPGVFGRVGSDATVFRTITALAADSVKALRALKKARAQARAKAWAAAGDAAPGAGGRLLVIDLDATLVTAHSDKEHAEPTYKRGFGFHPLWAFADHGPDGSGEPLAVLLRPGERREQHRHGPHRRHERRRRPAPHNGQAGPPSADPDRRRRRRRPGSTPRRGCSRSPRRVWR